MPSLRRCKSAPGRIRWPQIPRVPILKAKDKRAPPPSLADVMRARLEQTQNDPFDVRQRIFRELQRQMHPDKNLDREEEAKSAFQQLMEQKRAYLAPAARS
mmetsp:Transcript_111341/g.347063  ORF Transcript_111341/g.347063 Transcript_111341/m.347063 type:complete len:101 (+) Transcript_111341:2-304(+)